MALEVGSSSDNTLSSEIRYCLIGLWRDREIMANLPDDLKSRRSLRYYVDRRSVRAGSRHGPSFVRAWLSSPGSAEMSWISTVCLLVVIGPIAGNGESDSPAVLVNEPPAGMDTNDPILLTRGQP